MLSTSTLNQLEEWGYLLLPPVHPNSLGFGGLLVLIRDTPVEAIFCPRTIVCSLGTSAAPPARSVLTTGVTPPEAQQVGAGAIRVVGKAGETQHFFSFGGTVSAESHPHEIVYFFQSPAPILALRGHDVASLFAAEAEAMLAVDQARLKLTDEKFSAYLSEQAPLALYKQALQHVVDTQMPQEAEALLRAVKAEQTWLTQAQ
jgi:hypothetical protein